MVTSLSHMTKKILGLILMCVYVLTPAQTLYDAYSDGKVYLKVHPNLLLANKQENPRNISLKSLNFLSPFISKYGISKVDRPFFTAADDADLPYILRLEFNKIEKVNNLIQELGRLKGVVYAEKVPLMKTDATPSEGIPTHLAQINAANAWNVFNGNSNIKVAIIDNAVMWTHVDLVQNTYTNTAEIPGNNIDDDGNGYIDDVNGFDVSDWDNNTNPTNLSMDHGTHCAGIAAGRTDNGIGIASIGWNVKFIPIKAQTNSGSPAIVANGFEGIVYAVKAKANIISCSWGNSGSSLTEQSVINYAWNRGCIIIASAGNNNSTTQNYPGAYSNVYCVAAVETTDVKWGFSNYGTWVDICAPGTSIQSTVPYTSTPLYNTYSGTSMATPVVAGLAALMLSKSPNMTRTDVLNCISSTAVNVYTITGNTAYSANSLLGAGRIEAFAAMNCAATYSALPPVANFFAFPRQSCPNTPVQFTDSSLYAPTAWNWSFQGGSPATSTSSNPSVQWASPGTYSVTLTVSNASGTNTISKLAYVNVAVALPLPFSEGFENAQFIPANWSPNNIGNDDIFWTRRANLGAYGTSTACAMFDNYSLNAADERDELRTPKFNCSNSASVSLRFDVAYARYNANFSDTLEVKISTDCGSSWTTIFLKGGSLLSTAADASNLFVPTNTQWRTESVPISTIAAAQGNVMFSFINRGHYGQVIYLDNINLFFPTPTLSVVHSPSICVNSNVVYNSTLTSAFSQTWNFQGASVASSTLASPTVSYSNPGTFTATLFGVNGTASASVTRTISVLPFPVLSVIGTTVCSGNTAVLNVSGASTYSWYAGTNFLSSGASFSISNPVSTNYTVLGNNGGCVSSFTTALVVTPSPTVSVSNATICPGGSAILSASGAANYSWSTNATSASISVAPVSTSTYNVIGTTGLCNDVKTATVVVSPSVIPIASINPSIVCAGDTVSVTASGAQSYSFSTGQTTNSFTFIPTTNLNITISGTVGLCTGSTQAQLNVIQQPTVIVSVNPIVTLCAGNAATLQASGASTYSWNNGAQTSSTIVMPLVNTIYSVTGSNAGCSRTQTISVNTFALPIVTASSNLNLICANESATLSASGASSYVFFPGGPGANIVVTPSATTSYTVIGTDANGCSNTAIITQSVDACNNLKESEVNISGIKIFPNPTKGILNVELDSEKQVVVVNAIGQIVHTAALKAGLHQINLEGMANGVYLLRLSNAFDSKTIKVIKE